MDPKKDYYKILGINENASQDDIKKAYRKLAKQYHPDTHSGDKKAEERFKNVSEAYAVLKDEKKRREYDMMRKNPFAGAGQNGFGFNPGSQQQGGGFRVNFGEGGSGGFGGFDDLLGSLFGFGGKRSGGFSGSSQQDAFRGRSRQPRKGADVQAEVSIPFELAARGGETMVQTPTGKRVKLKIQPGTDSGKKMKISGQGSPSPAGGPAGDLYIILKVKPHAKYERKGNDIYATEKINMAQAVLGTEIEVTTIQNKKVKLRIPAGSDSGKLFRLKGLGIQAANGKGDHYVRIEITTPDKLSSKARKSFEEWARGAGLL